MSLLIAIPAWGERHLKLVEEVVYPSVRRALGYAGIAARFVIHTDNPFRLERTIRSNNIQYLPRPFHINPDLTNPHCEFEETQREAVDWASPGDVVVLLNGDTVCSIEAFRVAHELMAKGKKLVAAIGTRTCAPSLPPIGAVSRALAHWVWQWRHPWIEDCVWGRGKTECPSLLFFELADGVVAHGFHLHPFAFVKHAGLTYRGTSDWGLPDNFKPEEVHVITHEFALAEMSPPDCGILPGTERKLSVEALRQFAPTQTNMHRHFFRHRIVMDGECTDRSDVPICEAIVEGLS